MTDEQRDAHLRAALRHAPDADVQPPPALSALILKEAQAKARDASGPARAPRQPLWSLWDWLARPAVATGFAGVMVATLVGLMWWDQPMDEAMPRPPVPVAAPVPASVPASPPAATKPPAAPMLEATRPAPQQTPAPQRKSAPVTRPAPAATPAPEMAAREETAAPAAREAAPPVALSAPPPAPAPAAAADTATAGAPALARAQSFEESKRQRSMASADTLSKAAKTAETRAAEAPQQLAQLRAAIAAEPARWSWQHDGTPPQAINDAMLSWLARLDAGAGDRWQPVDASMLRAGREIRLLRDGRMAHGLRLVEGGVLWQLPQARWQFVTLPPTSLNALETSAP